MAIPDFVEDFTQVVKASINPNNEVIDFIPTITPSAKALVLVVLKI